MSAIEQSPPVTTRRRPWWGLRHLIHDAVDATTHLVAEGHASAARRVLQVTDHLGAVRDPARRIEHLHRRALGATLGTLRAVNRALRHAADLGLDALPAPASAGRGATPDAAPDTSGGDRNPPQADRTKASADGSRPTAAPDPSTAHARRSTADPAPATERVVALRSDTVGTRRWLGDAGLGVANGLLGDRLHHTENGLALDLRFRIGEHYLAFAGPADPAQDACALRALDPPAGPRLALFVHGLAATEWSWCLNAEAWHGDASLCFGTLLARDAHIAPIYLRYNTGRPIADNGRLLAEALERLLAAWPTPVHDLTLVGHSMGGLVIRQACQEAQARGLTWTHRVHTVFSLGAPHEGAPLARLGEILEHTLGAIDLPGTLIPARILAQRSAGIRDLSRGLRPDPRSAPPNSAQPNSAQPNSAQPSDRTDPHPWAAPNEGLLPHARHCFIATTLTRAPGHPAGHLLGDLLVRVPSAQGARLGTSRATFEIERHHLGGVLHHQIQNHPAVYPHLLRACLAAHPEPGT